MPGINLVTQLRNPQATTAGGGFESGMESDSPPSLVERLRSLSGSGASDWERADTIRLVLALVGIAGFFGIRYFADDYKARQEAELQAQVAELDQQIASEKRKLEGLKSFRAEAEAYDKQMAELQRKIELVESASKGRNLVIRMVDFVVTEMPPTIWLGRLTVETATKNEIDITGSALNLQIVSEYVKRLEGAVFFPKWQLKETVAEAGNSGTNAAGGRAVPMPDTKKFQVSAKVVPL